MLNCRPFGIANTHGNNAQRKASSFFSATKKPFFARLIPLELGRLVRSTYVECLGPLDQEVTTMDLLKRIELRMEFLTQHLERLPQEKVKIAQRVRLLELIIHMSTAKIGFCRFEEKVNYVASFTS